jgi:hypothetical protein
MMMTRWWSTESSMGAPSPEHRAHALSTGGDPHGVGDLGCVLLLSQVPQGGILLPGR